MFKLLIGLSGLCISFQKFIMGAPYVIFKMVGLLKIFKNYRTHTYRKGPSFNLLNFAQSSDFNDF